MNKHSDTVALYLSLSLVATKFCIFWEAVFIDILCLPMFELVSVFIYELSAFFFW
jgi:hypothetical protein